jgi:hypothetical protein
MALVSVTAVIVTTRSAVQSLKEQSQIIVESLKDQIKTLTVSVDKLDSTTQHLTIEVALRDERFVSLAQRLSAAESDIKSTRTNVHNLRNWLLSIASDLGRPEGIHEPPPEQNA